MRLIRQRRPTAAVAPYSSEQRLPHWRHGLDHLTRQVRPVVLRHDRPIWNTVVVDKTLTVSNTAVFPLPERVLEVRHSGGPVTTLAMP
eukprot:SAG22_NODE_14138_length_383_cov_1.059859_1_plen_87_part_10